jgi:hypothetical protein
MEILDIEEVQTAPKTELAPIERAAIALESSKTEQHLMALATKHQSITVVKDKAGREQAHGAYIEVMRARTAVEKASKDAREDATKFSKAVIAEAARLVAIVEPEEARLKEARDAWDAEQARIKAEAEARERARVLAITERIAAIKAYVVLANNCRTSARVAELQVKLCDTEMTGFEEFEAEAAQAFLDATEHLSAVLADRLAQEAEAARIKAEQEAEAARLKAEREELDRQRAEAAAQAKAQAEADRAELDRQRKEMNAQRAAAQAEAKRVADEARAQAEAAAEQKFEQPQKPWPLSVRNWSACVQRLRQRARPLSSQSQSMCFTRPPICTSRCRPQQKQPLMCRSLLASWVSWMPQSRLWSRHLKSLARWQVES